VNPSKHSWHRLALIGVVLLAVVLSFWRLEQEGYGNLYYAATVKSMLTSWHNFFFASFDPGGFVTVDKPPLGFWVQAASAALLGFNGWSLLLPQALAGVLSVILLYHLVRRVFGPTAGLLAALALAVTPISVAANRNNTIDSLLVLVLLLAAWAVSRAAGQGRLRWLLLGALLVGLGFNVKMMQAYMVLPAFYLLYLIASPLPCWKRLAHLALATVLLLVVSLSWAVIVDLTSADRRPFIGSSKDNTVMELIIGHNALARLLPGGLRGGSPAGPPQPPPGWRPGQPRDGQPPLPPPGGRPGQQPPLPPGRQPSQPTPPSGPGGSQPFAHEIGERGALRLFNRQLAGQISWLLPLAGLGLLAAAWQTPLDRRRQALLLWSAWLLPQVVFFSIANLFHRYYLAMMAPAIAALVGAGVVALWDDYHRAGDSTRLAVSWRGWLLPLALIVGAVVEAVILAEFPDWSRWLTPLVGGLGLGTAGVLIAARLAGKAGRRVWPAVVATVGVLALLVAPTVWAVTPVWYGGDVALPYAGPELLETPSRRGNLPDVSRLVDYLLAHRGREPFLAATLNANTAAPLILATGEPVMALGGFSGGDQILSAEGLAAWVTGGALRFFLVSGQGGAQEDLVRWITTHCKSVPRQQWQSAIPAGGGAPDLGPGSASQLFDCGAR
jgi:4-amino-4-deoxy-L-arabinose transferase-like glycosyltransferase